MQVAAEEIKQGDKVLAVDGRVLKVRAVMRGMISGHVHIGYSNGEWSEVKKQARIDLVA